MSEIHYRLSVFDEEVGDRVRLFGYIAGLVGFAVVVLTGLRSEFVFVKMVSWTTWPTTISITTALLYSLTKSSVFWKAEGCCGM